MADFFPGFEERRVATSGAEINLVSGGSGPPLLLLHGYPQTHVLGRMAEDKSPLFMNNLEESIFKAHNQENRRIAGPMTKARRLSRSRERSASRQHRHVG